MLTRFKNSLVFRLEQIMVRGPLWRFALILVLIVIVSLLAGLVVRTIAPGFESEEDAFWWAFLRLTDPGYLGDDTGMARGTVSTVVTILGSVLFTGALIAILVQWWDDTMGRLEMGLTPVALDTHFVLLGWTSRTLTIIEELLVSQGRVERFLRQRGARRLRVVLLAERVDASLRQEIKLQLGERWNDRQIILRSGSALNLDDLERVDFMHAGAILLPAADTTVDSTLDADTHTVKTLMTIGAAMEDSPAEELPLIVVESQDTRYIATLRALYRGSMEIIAGDEVISRLVTQNVRHPGLSHVYGAFLSDASRSQIYVRQVPQLAGVAVQQLTNAFPKGVFLGVVRPQGDGFQALLNPPNDLRLEAGDRIAVLASSHKDAEPAETVAADIELRERAEARGEAGPQRRVLVLGWNHRVPALLKEFASYPKEKFAIDVVSQISVNKREKRIAIESLSTDRLSVTQLEFDYTVPAYLESVDPASYDNVVLLTSERLKSGAESDARTILGYLLLREQMSAQAESPAILVELSDPDNVSLFDNRRGEVIVSTVLISHMLARVALRRELHAVFDELFSSDGYEIIFRGIKDYGLAQGEYAFVDLQQAADTRGEIALGIRRAGLAHTPQGGAELNPGRDEHLQLSENDALIVLTSYK